MRNRKKDLNMTTSTLQSFAQSTGQSANNRTGEFSGSLLGKIASGPEAMAAIKSLSAADVGGFMGQAIKAANVDKTTLAATRTIPFASPDLNFNPTLNPEKAAIAAKAPKPA